MTDKRRQSSITSTVASAGNTIIAGGFVSAPVAVARHQVFEKEWSNVAQVVKIRRWVKKEEEEREEIVYALTNLPRAKAGARQLLEINQKHWSIENRLHYRRDVTLGEDACQVRKKNAPQALAALNGGILALMDWLSVRNVASQMRHFCAHPQEAIQLLLEKLSR
jgi:predicted transposase YbfD/YdcC